MKCLVSESKLRSFRWMDLTPVRNAWAALQSLRSPSWAASGCKGKRKAAEGSAHCHPTVLWQGTAPTWKTLTFTHGLLAGLHIQTWFHQPSHCQCKRAFPPKLLYLAACRQASTRQAGIYSALMRIVFWVFTQSCWTAGGDKAQFHIFCYLLTTCEANSTGERWQPNLCYLAKQTISTLKKKYFKCWWDAHHCFSPLVLVNSLQARKPFRVMDT